MTRNKNDHYLPTIIYLPNYSFHGKKLFTKHNIRFSIKIAFESNLNILTRILYNTDSHLGSDTF